MIFKKTGVLISLCFVFGLLVPTEAFSLTAKDVKLAPPPSHPDFPKGSKMSYRVDYGILDIGTLVGEILGKTNYKGNEVYKGKFSIRSSSLLKRITFGQAKVWEDIYTYVDSKGLYSRHYFQISDSLGRRFTRSFEFDYKNLKNRVILKNFTAKSLQTNAVDIYGPMQDGVSTIFYTMSLFEEESGTWKIPTMGTARPEYLSLSVKPGIRPVEVHDRILKARYMKGRLHYQGLLGIGGEFDGYFHPDWPHWPIKASLNVWLGNVRLLLTEEDAEKVYRMQARDL